MSLFGIVAAENWKDARFADVSRARVGVVYIQTRDGHATPLARVALTREPWAFVHDGAIEDVGLLRPRISQRRALDAREGSPRETLLNFLLSSIDSSDSIDAGLLRAVGEIRNAGARGIFTFILTNGTTLYAFRSGTTLSVRIRGDVVIVASEPLTDESWMSLSEAALVRIDRGVPICCRWLASGALTDASGPELPFTD